MKMITLDCLPLRICTICCVKRFPNHHLVVQKSVRKMYFTFNKNVSKICFFISIILFTFLETLRYKFILFSSLKEKSEQFFDCHSLKCRSQKGCSKASEHSSLTNSINNYCILLKSFFSSLQNKINQFVFMLFGVMYNYFF